MRNVRFILVILLVACAYGQTTITNPSMNKKMEKLKTDYAKAISSTIEELKKNGYIAIDDKIGFDVDTKELFSDAGSLYLYVDVQVVKPYETSGEIPDQVKKVIRENLLKIIRILNANLDDLTTSNNISGVRINMTWGPNDSSTDIVTVLINKNSIKPFIEGEITLREFMNERARIIYADQQLKLQF